jgi:large conductance mechanosensitive channel
MLKEFRDFVARGNVLDLAVAVILGVAFNAVIQSLVNDVLTPIIAAIGGEPNFGDLTLSVGDGRIKYGLFLNAVFSFLIMGFTLFMIVKALAAVQRADKGGDEAPVPSDEALLLTEIRDLLAAGPSRSRA